MSGTVGPSEVSIGSTDDLGVRQALKVGEPGADRGQYLIELDHARPRPRLLEPRTQVRRQIVLARMLAQNVEGLLLGKVGVVLADGIDEDDNECTKEEVTASCLSAAVRSGEGDGKAHGCGLGVGAPLRLHWMTKQKMQHALLHSE